MSNDTSIHRINTDASAPVIRKKPNSDAIDVSKRSFFEELLSIGQFESSLPDIAGTQSASSSSTSVDSDSQSNSAVSDDSTTSEGEDSGEPTTTQPAYAAQALAQQPLAPQPSLPALKDAGSDRDNDDSKSTEKIVVVQQTDNAVLAKSSTGEEPAAGGKNGKAQAASNTQTAKSVEDDIGAILVEQRPAQNANKTPLDGSKNTSKSKTSRDTKTSSNSAVSNAQEKQSRPDFIDLKHAHADSKSKRSTEVSEMTNQNPNQENIDGNPSQVRNKRAERLAQQATESDPDPDKRDDPSSEPSIASSIEASKKEIMQDKSSVSEGSEPNSSSPISSSAVVITPSTAFNASASSTSSSKDIRQSVEGISAIATSSLRGGIQTNTSNTTFAGSVSNPARAEQGKAEVARSNAGSHISAYQEAKLVQRVLRGVEQLANGGGQVRLRLHPPELGSLQMSLRMEAGQVYAKLEVESTTARDALLNNVQALKDRMAEQGMQVAAFEVEVSTDSSGLGNSGSNFQSDGGSGSESRWNNATSRFAQQNNNRLSPEPVLTERGAAWTRTNGSLDLTV